MSHTQPLLSKLASILGCDPPSSPHLHLLQTSSEAHCLGAAMFWWRRRRQGCGWSTRPPPIRLPLWGVVGATGGCAGLWWWKGVVGNVLLPPPSSFANHAPSSPSFSPFTICSFFLSLSYFFFQYPSLYHFLLFSDGFPTFRTFLFFSLYSPSIYPFPSRSLSFPLIFVPFFLPFSSPCPMLLYSSLCLLFLAPSLLLLHFLSICLFYSRPRSLSPPPQSHTFSLSSPLSFCFSS